MHTANFLGTILTFTIICILYIPTFFRDIVSKELVNVFYLVIISIELFKTPLSNLKMNLTVCVIAIILEHLYNETAKIWRSLGQW